MNNPSHDDWREPLLRWTQTHATSLGLRGDRLTLTRVVNPTGWYANVSCTIADGVAQFHAKRSREPAALRHVLAVADLLTSRYRMPPILAWIDLGEWTGILMPSIPSVPAPESLIPTVMDLADRLHADVELAAALPQEGRPASFREAFLTTWIERFTTDLAEIESSDNAPPFVSAATMRWMRRETGRLADMTATAAFAAKPVAVVHGDLQLANVLVEATGRWWLVDWDEMGYGDPAADLAMLLTPSIERDEPVEAWLGRRDPDFLHRFELHRRAVLLDLVIDSLADWADAERVPEAAAAVRTAKRAAHERGLAVYRKRYR